MKTEFSIDWSHWLIGVNRFNLKNAGLQSGCIWGFHFGPFIWMVVL